MPVTLQRLLPNPEILGKKVLEQSGIKCEPTVPKSIASKLPLFTLYRIGGASRHPKFLDRASMHLITWGATYVAAREAAETARALFFQAWYPKPWSTSDGVINRIDETSAPAETPDANQPDGVFRFDSLYTFWTRPPAG